VFLNQPLVNLIEAQLRISVLPALVPDLFFAFALLSVFFAPLLLFLLFFEFSKVDMLSEATLLLPLDQLLIGLFDLFGNLSLLLLFKSNFIFAPLFLCFLLSEDIICLFN
jgi:hypothetical protein